MGVVLKRFALLGVWLTIVAIASGGIMMLPAHAAPDQPLAGANEPNGTRACEICRGQPASRDSGNGGEVAKRSESSMLAAIPSSARLLVSVRVKDAGSLVLDKPQADRHVLLALERSAAASSTACLPLLRSTHLRI
ncbi:MAG TPA: hypothetical protein VIK18_26080 [Pirellulales bacterium]